MLTLTIGDVLKLDALNGETDYCVYIIRDGETVFYVGRSARVHERVMSHLGYGALEWTGVSHVGRFILRSAPQSLQWQVDFMTYADCEQCAAATGKPFLTGTKQRRSQEVAEKFMIRHFRPCLNIADNPLPNRLPERYLGVSQDLTSAPCDVLGLKL